MKERLNIVVSSGGTDVPLDDVRVISNLSSGSTGAFIAGEGLRRGHEVHLLRSKRAKQVFADLLTVRVGAENAEAELERLRAAFYEVRALMTLFRDEVVRDFDAYRRRLLEIIADTSVDVAILSMAASDFGPEKVSGKIRSDANELLFSLKPLPKIISEIKKTRQGIFLVGFKFLTEDSTPDALVERAYSSLLRDKQDLAVANLGRMGTKDLRTYLVTKEKGIIAVPERSDLPGALLQSIEERFSRRHYSSRVHRVDQLSLPVPEVESFLAEIKRIAKLALFPAYIADAREEFGFVAARAPKGMLITARGSSKTDATQSDIALVSAVDEQSRVIHTESLGKKASLNANVAYAIFRERPEIHRIVHAHIDIPHAFRVSRQTAPGTQEDWEGMRDLIIRGENVIFQPGHGVFILLERMEDLIPLLRERNMYSSRPEYYDLAYHRFQHSSGFMRLSERFASRAGVILDLAAGTGEVSKQLRDHGFDLPVMMDASLPMLGIAAIKHGITLPSHQVIHGRMQDLDIRNTFDTVLLRQAVNYVPPEELVAVFRNVRRALRNCGVFVFNSFVPNEGTEGLRLPRRYDVSGGNVLHPDHRHIVLTQEGNLKEDRLLHHGQRTEMFNLTTGEYELMYDVNSFYCYTPQEFEEALGTAGFKHVSNEIVGSSVSFVAHS